MARQRNPTMTGDMRLAAGDSQSHEQPLDERARALVRRAYELYEHFREKLGDEHDEMRAARRMRQLKQDERSRTAPSSNTLNSCMDNVIADQIDNMPEAKLIPEREETMNSAEELTDVVSYILYQAGWPYKYQRLMEDAVVTGTGVAEVFWDDDADDGEGMVSVLAWHPEDFYPDPMVEELQDVRACFKTTLTTVAWVEEHYPHAKGYVKADPIAQEEEHADPMYEPPAGDQQTTLLEFWYKRYDAEKRKYRVHMAQFAGRALLYSTELEFGGPKKGEYKEGVYAHGQYPFVLYRYREVFRRPFGTGLVHDYRGIQNAIDRALKYIDDNARQSSIQRTFIRKGSGVNPDEIADLNRTIIEWEGSDIREVMQTVQANPLNGQVYQIMQYHVDSMKQDCGQNQFSRGEGGLGVTAASAIQALQDAGGKITRWHTEQFKSAFKEMIVQILWVLSEYMTPERTLRIVGGWDSTGNMLDRKVTVSAPRAEGDELKRPAYSVRVQVQRNNPLEYQAFNELLNQAATVCAQAGQPMPPEVYIALLQGFSNKSSVLKAVQQTSRMHAQVNELTQTVQQLQAQLAQQQQANTGMLEGLQTPGGAAGTDAQEHSGAEQIADPAGAQATA